MAVGVQLHGNFTPASISSSPTHSLRRFERSNHDGRGVSLSILMGYRQQSTTIALDSQIIARSKRKSWRMNQVAHHQ